MEISRRAPAWGGCLLGVVVGAVPVRPASAAEAPEVVFFEPFEPGALAQWQVSRWDTRAVFEMAEAGPSSGSSLEVRKDEIAGLMLLQRQVPVQPGRHYRLSMDLQTLKLRPLATYFLRVGYLDARGERLGAFETLAFDDGLAYNSGFGGQNKLPQTLGAWQKTQHLIQTPPEAVALDLAIVVGQGQMHVRFDNLRLVDLGEEAPSLPTDPPVFTRDIHSAAVARFDLDMLVPGWTYEVHATADSDSLDGMGIAMAWVDAQGQVHDRAELPVLQREGKQVWYRLRVPERAVAVELDLHNEDLLRLGHGDINRGDGRAVRVPAYRNWRSIAVRVLSRSMVVDTQYHNYVYGVGEDHELIRPRDLVEVTEFDRRVIDAHIRQRSPVDARVVNHHGGMAIQVGDAVLPPMIHAQVHAREYDFFSRLAQDGSAKILRLQNAVGGPALNGQWAGPETYDFSGVDEVIYRALKQNPAAHLILDTGALYPPFWWGDAHPQEIIQDQDGRLLMSQDSYMYRVIWGAWDGGRLAELAEARHTLPMIRVQGAHRSTTYVPSTVSEPYRRDMAQFVAAMRRHIESQPYGPAVIGYMLSWGYDMQWALPSSGEHWRIDAPQRVAAAEHAFDYSPPMLRHFRAFLKNRYGTDQALQQAWNDSQVTLVTAEIPSPQARAMPYKGPYLLDPGTRRAVIDFEMALDHSIGDLLDAMGQAVKRAGDRQVITLAYFQDEYRDLGHGHVLASSGLDITGGPSYQARELGLSGVTPQVMDSYRLHGKLAMTEVDHRTFVTSYRRYKGNQVFETPRKTISMLQREFARHMCDGGGAWTLDMGYGWFAHPIVTETLGRIHRIFEEVLEHDRSSIAEVGVFLGDYAMHSSRHPNIGRARDMRQGPRISLSQSGVPSSVYRLEDLATVADRYRVFVFPHAWALTAEERQQVMALQRDGNLLVFGAAPGHADEAGFSPAHVEALLGMQVQRDDALPMLVEVKAGAHPLVLDVGGFIGERLSSDVAFPVYHVTDPQAVALGHYAGTPDRVGFAYKDHGDWQSVYLGVIGYWPPEFFTALARLQGLHVFGQDGDVMHFARSLVAVHASTDGLKTLELPEPMRVRSLWDRKDLGVIQTIRRPMQVGENALYLLQPQ